MATELTSTGAVIPTDEAGRIAEIEKVLEECSLSRLGELKQFQRSFQLARGMQRLRDLISDQMMKDIMALQNTALGFLTDKKDQQSGKPIPYPVEIVKEVFIEATLRGFRPINNEFNIISGRFYGAKNGYVRLCREFPGVAKLEVKKSVPRQNSEKGAIVLVSATWELHGKPQEIKEYELPIRVNAGQGADAIWGKVERKVHAQIYEKLSGIAQSDGDVDDADVDSMRRVDPDANGDGAAKPAASKADELNERLGGGAATASTSAAASEPACSCPDGPAGTHEPPCALNRKPNAGPAAAKASPKTDDYL